MRSRGVDREGCVCVDRERRSRDEGKVCVAVCCMSKEHIVPGERPDRRDQLHKLPECQAKIAPDPEPQAAPSGRVA